MTPRPSRRTEWCVALLLGLLCAVAVAPGAAVGTRSLVPGAALRYDPVFAEGVDRNIPERAYWDRSTMRIHYPAQSVAAAQIRDGSLPLWNPTIGAGAPLLAEAHAAPLSPFLIPFYLAPSETTYSWHLLLRTLVAAFAMFLLARRLGIARLGASLSSIAYACGGFAAVRFDLATELSAYALLPIIASAAMSAVEGRRGGVSLLAIAIAVVIYSAHPSPALVAGLVGCGFAMSAQPGCVRAWIRLGAGVGLGVAVAALVVIPLVHFAFVATTYKLDSDAVSGLVGSPLYYFSASPGVLRFGGAVLVLAGVSVISSRSSRSSRVIARAVWIGGGLLLAVLAMRWLAPAPYNVLILPRYAVFGFGFALALSAGAGLGRWLERGLSPRALGYGLVWGVAVWLITDYATGGELFRVAHIWIGDLVGIGAVVAVVLLAPARRRFVAGVSLVAVAGVALIFSHQRALEVLGDGTPRSHGRTAVQDLASPPDRVVGVGVGPTQAALIPNVGSLFGLADVRSAAALYPARYAAYMKLAGVVAGTTTYVESTRSPLIELFGASYALVPTILRDRSDWPVVGSAGSLVDIRRAPEPVPRAFVARAVVAASGPERAGSILVELAEAGRLPETAVVEASAERIAGLSGADGTAWITRYDSQRVDVEVRVDREGLLVLTDTYFPGWDVRVDGAEASMVAVDVLFRGVIVPAGEHRVVFEYRPAAVSWGLAVAALALALCGLLWFIPIPVLEARHEHGADDRADRQDRKRPLPSDVAGDDGEQLD